MKKIIRFIVVISIVLLVNNNVAQAQKSQKIGHINSAELLQMMPGREEAQNELMGYAKELEDQLKIMTQEFETKYQDYLANETKFTEIVKKSKQTELTDFQARINDFQESAQEDLANKENELVAPLLQKAQDAIKDVAKEKGYNYILDVSAGSVLYFDETEDIMPFVKKKIGIE